MTFLPFLSRLTYRLVLILIVAISFPYEALALDVVYFTNSAAGTIESVEADGMSRKVLVSGLSDPQAIEVDASNGLMFWSDAPGGVRRIARANLDGSNVTTVTNAGNAADISMELASILRAS